MEVKFESHLYNICKHKPRKFKIKCNVFIVGIFNGNTIWHSKYHIYFSFPFYMIDHRLYGLYCGCYHIAGFIPKLSLMVSSTLIIKMQNMIILQSV